MSGITPVESDFFLRKRDQAMVRDGYAMGVTAQILAHKLWSPEGWFQVDDPIFPVQRSQPSGKDLRLSEEGEVSLEAELAVTEGLPESVDKLSEQGTAGSCKWCQSTNHLRVCFLDTTPSFGRYPEVRRYSIAMAPATHNDDTLKCHMACNARRTRIEETADDDLCGQRFRSLRFQGWNVASFRSQRGNPG
jgi:hypothetical protein